MKQLAGAEAGMTVAVVSDNRTYDTMHHACMVLHGNEIDFIALHYPTVLQREMKRLPSIYHSVLAQADICLTMFTEAAPNTHFRTQVVGAAMQSGCKVLHMPGIDSEIVSMCADAEYADVGRRVVHYAELLTLGREVEIHTRDTSGKTHKLECLIEERIGHPDGCPIDFGEVMNFPTGEAYIAPIEDSATGTIALNGSIPSHVLEDEAYVLRFENGVLQFPKNPPSEMPLRGLLETISQAAALDEGRSAILGEFGLGCNSSFERLTGREIVDEKALGTAHIGVGDNEALGGKNCNARVHLDLVFYPDRILIDGVAVSLDY